MWLKMYLCTTVVASIGALLFTHEEVSVRIQLLNTGLIQTLAKRLESEEMGLDVVPCLTHGDWSSKHGLHYILMEHRHFLYCCSSIQFSYF